MDNELDEEKLNAPRPPTVAVAGVAKDELVVDVDGAKLKPADVGGLVAAPPARFDDDENEKGLLVNAAPEAKLVALPPKLN